jgi:hypothetical protein
VGLKAVNCRSGDVLANEQATASGKEQVLKALGEAATKIPSLQVRDMGGRHSCWPRSEKVSSHARLDTRKS